MGTAAAEVIRIAGILKINSKMLARFGFYSYLCGMEKDCDINPNTDFGLKKLFEQAEIARYSESERRQYYESQKEYWDYYSTMKTSYDKGRAKGHAQGRAEGLAEGRAEGLAEGRAEERIANARRMKELGIDCSVISQVTGLTVEEIETL